MTFLDAIKKAIPELFPDLFFSGLFEYQITKDQGGKYTLRPIDSKWLPPIPLVSIWGGVPGLNATVKVGSIVLIQFVNRDEKKPVIVGFPPVSATLGKPSVIAIDGDDIRIGSGTAPGVRHGDTIDITPGNGSGPVTGVITITSGTAETPPAVSRVLL